MVNALMSWNRRLREKLREFISGETVSEVWRNVDREVQPRCFAGFRLLPGRTLASTKKQGRSRWSPCSIHTASTPRLTWRRSRHC
jgi:hypothetical protein